MSFWKEWATKSNAPVPFSDRAGQLIKIMREKTGAAEKRQGSQEITRAVQLLFLPVGKKSQECTVLKEIHLRDTHWKTVSASWGNNESNKAAHRRDESGRKKEKYLKLDMSV